jgi:Fic family protein
MTYTLPLLPPKVDLETKVVLKKLASSHRYLAELKGVVETIPNEAILISTLTLQEAKDSSEIENIITTHDELYKTTLFENELINPAAKEVSRYASALRTGFEKVRKTGLITTNMIISLYQELEGNNGGIRTQPGTTLKNDKTGEIVYTPPQQYEDVLKYAENLEIFINDNDISDLDPLIKMAVIHHQFESIHPFYDGNGRTGRIINILYLVAQGLLDIPVLYLSRYIISNKTDYYELLQSVRDNNEWEKWLLFILEGIEITSQDTLTLVGEIKKLMQEYKHRMRNELPKIYSQELLNNIFSQPYTKIQFVERDLNVTRLTATKYLELLVKHGFLKKHKLGRNNYYVNDSLFDLFLR